MTDSNDAHCEKTMKGTVTQFVQLPAEWCQHVRRSRLGSATAKLGFTKIRSRRCGNAAVIGDRYGLVSDPRISEQQKKFDIKSCMLDLLDGIKDRSCTAHRQQEVSEVRLSTKVTLTVTSLDSFR